MISCPCGTFNPCSTCMGEVLYSIYSFHHPKTDTNNLYIYFLYTGELVDTQLSLSVVEVFLFEYLNALQFV